MNTLLIVQARMGSSRLPNKVLMDLCCKPMLQHIVERVKLCTTVDHVIVATTQSQKDDAIERLCSRQKFDCYRGSEDDVLDRYYRAARQFSPKNVVRVTADCPLIDPKIIDDIIRKHIEGDFDYTSNTLVETYPDGLDTEVFKYSVLCEAWEKAELMSEREHVTPYIKFKGDYKRFSIERIPSLADKRWTVDTEADYEMIQQIYSALYKENKTFYTDDILDYLSRNPDIEKMNAGIIRNEGYQKSIKNDTIAWKKD